MIWYIPGSSVGKTSVLKVWHTAHSLQVVTMLPIIYADITGAESFR